MKTKRLKQVVGPFNGVLYNLDKIRGMEKVVAPPYDVISPKQKEELYQKDPHNVVRLILPIGENPYHEAAQTFHQWLDQGILVQNGHPSIYIYHQTFSIKGGRRPKGKKYLRKGLLALRRLEPWGQAIFPHEKTLSAPKKDRLRLLRECRANLSPVFSLYSDHQRKIDSFLKPVLKKPFFDITTEDEIRHQFWKISDTAVVAKVCFFLAQKKLTIADGHHRYETALAYSQERARRRGSSDHSILMFFSNIDDPGLIVLPTHRLYHSPRSLDWDKIQKKLVPIFKVKKFPVEKKRLFLKELEGAGSLKMGLVLPGEDLILLETTFKKLASSSLAGGIDKVHLALGVTLLHDILVPKILGLKGRKASLEKNFTFEKEAESVLSEVRSQKATAGFILPPPRIQDVVSISEKRKTLSQKTTYFYPKLLSGLVFHKFD